jgi:hypothetical protein
MARPGNPNMVKGAPSLNPAGRGAAFAKAVVEKAKAAAAAGSDGVISYGGHYQGDGGETSSKLTGRQKWIEYANAYACPPIAIALLLRSALLRGVKWSLTENPAGGRLARRGKQIVEEGLLKARMPKSWNVVAARAANGAYFDGFSIHATGMARRPDGLVTYTEIDERPPHTIHKWMRPTPTERFNAVEQRTDDGGVYPIPLAECLYVVNDTFGNAPDGPGVLRLVVDRIRRFNNYEALEGSEYFSGMGGTPIARVPLEEIGNGLVGSEEEITAKKKARVSNIETIVSHRVKTPEKRMYVVLDSATYKNDDGTFTNIPKWSIEIVKAELQGLPEMRKTLTDYELDIARIVGVEFVFVGGGDTAGTYGMHESKVSLLGAQLGSDTAMVAAQGTELGRRLVERQGLDPDVAAPTVVASPIATEDILKAAQTLVQVGLAGLAPNHPAKKAFFERLGLPWEDEAEPVMPRPDPAGGGGLPRPGANPDDVPKRDEPPVPDPKAKEPA